MLRGTLTRMRKGLPVCLAVTDSACSPLPAQARRLLLKGMHIMSGDAPGTFTHRGARSYSHYLMRLWRRRLHASAFKIHGALLAAKQQGGLQVVSL